MSESTSKRSSRSSSGNWKWIAGATIALVFAYATASGFVVYILYAFLLTMILSRLLTEVCIRGLDCKRELSKTEAVIGEELDIILTIKNKSALPIPWVLVEELLPDRMPTKGARARLLTLRPHHEEKMLYQVVLNRRGYHQIGPALVEAGDLFGFFKRYKTAAATDFVTVYPTLEHISEYDIAARRPMGPVKVTNRIFEDPSRIIGVREYVAGDPFNRIHWKTTARTGTLHCKVFEPSRVIGATIALDLHRDGYRSDNDRLELAIITAASLSNHVANANEQVGLVTNGRDLSEAANYEPAPLLGKIRNRIVSQARKSRKLDRLAPVVVPTRKSAEQGLVILETLARIDSTDGLTLDQTLQYSIQRLGRDSTLLVVVPEMPDELGVTLGILKESGYLVSVFIIDNEPGYFAAIDKLAAKYIGVYHIRGIEDIAKFARQDIYY